MTRSHPAPVSATGRHVRPLALAFAITVVFLVVEAAVSILTGSLALLSDAGHMLTDVIGLGMALAAARLATRSRAAHRTFGLYRLEVLAALGNALLLFGVAGYVLVEAIRRLGDPTDVDGAPVLLVAILGLMANLAAAALLRRGAGESLNVRGAYLDVLADALGSLGAIVAGVVLLTADWPYVDPIVGLAIAAFIVPRTWVLAGQAIRILVQAAPKGFDLAALDAELAAIPGVVDVHDVHVWTLTSDMEVASAHLMIESTVDAHGVLDRARELLARDFGVDHGTFQVEPDTHEGCQEHGW